MKPKRQFAGSMNSKIQDQQLDQPIKICLAWEAGQ